MAEYNIHYNIAALLIILILLLFFSLQNNLVTTQNKVFKYFILIVVMADAFDILTIMGFDHSAELPLWLQYFINQVYFVTFFGTAVAYYGYVLVTANEGKRLRLFDKLSVILPCAFEVILVFTSQWTHAIFYFEPDGQGGYLYCHGKALPVLYVITLLYLGFSLYITQHYSKSITRNQILSTYFYTVVNVIAMLVQILIFPNVMLVEFAVSTTIMLIFLNMENPETYQNKQLGIYNRYGTIKILYSLFEKNKPFSVMGMRVCGFHYVNETVGVQNGDLLLKELVDFFKEMAPDVQLVHLSSVRFAMIADQADYDWKQIAEKVRNRMDRPFVIAGMEVNANISMCSMEYGTQFETMEELLDLLDGMLQDEAKDFCPYVDDANSKELTGKRRESKIVHIMQQALKEDGFEVYYQPIYSVEKKRFISAEALIRLKSNEIGFISPEEFIPLAEKNGLILDIGEYVIESVCKFISKEKIWRRGIEYIEVNLSVVQCMQEKMYENIIAIMDRYHVDYNRINLEITETATVISKEALSKNMNKLIEKGITFSMDDYGTGYSNTEYMIQYPFHLIKIDKYIMWAAMENERAFCVLKYNVKMIKEMGMHIVVEGVETKEQANILEYMGCDYFQGYFYSKPVPVDDFIIVVEKMNGAARY